MITTEDIEVFDFKLQPVDYMKYMLADIRVFKRDDATLVIYDSTRVERRILISIPDKGRTPNEDRTWKRQVLFSGNVNGIEELVTIFRQVGI